MNVLFVCVGNSGRSLMAKRLLRRDSEGRHEGRSAGSAPGTAAHPQVLEALAEIGIDASDHVPQQLDESLVEWADVVVATCDDACPVIPGKRYVAWDLPDPKTMPLDEVRLLLDEIERLVEDRADTYGALGIATALLFSLVLVGRVMIISAELNAELAGRR